jgi:hypothetical protein
MRNAFGCVLIVSVMAVVPAGTFAQSVSPSQSQPAVTIPFFVTDRKGAPVTGIAPSDLVIRDDKLPVSAMTLRGPGDLPLRLAVVIQDSGMMRDNPFLSPTLAALPQFLRTVMSGSNDRVFLETFSDHVHASNWMTFEQVSRVSFDLRPWGMSALYDALESACAQLDADSTWPARRVVLFIGDGHDNHSRTSDDAAKAAILRSRSALFVLLIGPRAGAGPVPDYLAGELLKDVADESGGASIAIPRHWAPSFRLGEPVDVRESPATALVEIGGWIRGMYALSYIPAPSGHKKPHHAVKIKLVAKRGEWRMHAVKHYEEN